jgi:hypothetical protein
MPDARVLKDLVRSTFANSAFPRGTDVASHDCEECDRIREAFGQQAPFSLPGEVLEYYHDSLPLLSSEAFHHFLPAYLIYAVENPASLVAQSAWFSLSPPVLDEFYASRFGRFSEAEKAVVLQVAEYLINADKDLQAEEVERARRYWRAA